MRQGLKETSTVTPGPLPVDGKKVGIWLRVSTEDQARGESPQHHEARARMYAESKGWEVVTVYHLEGVSGKSVKDHPEALRMMQEVQGRRITGLIFSKLARLARNTRELLDFADFFKAEGADLISLQESIDTSSPAGRLFYTMIAAMATWEREEIAERVAASVPIRAKLGKSTGGQPPYGYRFVGGRLEVDPAEAPLRKLIYDLFKEHRRLKAVARILNESGYRTRKGGRFLDSSLRHILEDPTAKGLRRANYTTMRNGKLVLKPESEWVWTEVPAIVSPELWDGCNDLLTARRTGPRLGRPPVQLFTGLAFCTCGEKLSVPSNTPKWVCKQCRTKIPIVDLERAWIGELRAFLLSPEAISEHLAKSDEVLSGKEELLLALRGEAEKLTHEMDKLYRLYLQDGITVESFAGRNRPLEERARQLGEEVPRLQGEIDYLRIAKLGSAGVFTEAESLAERWETFSFEDKRVIVETLLTRVEVGKGQITFEIEAHPPPSEILTKRQSVPTLWIHLPTLWVRSGTQWIQIATQWIRSRTPWVRSPTPWIHSGTLRIHSRTHRIRFDNRRFHRA